MSAGQTISMDAHNGWGAGDTQSIYVLENPNKLESVQWVVTGGVEFIPDGNNPRQGVLKAIGGSGVGHIIVTGVDSGLTAECYVTVANYQVTPYEFTVNPSTLSLTAGSETGTVTGLVDGAAPTRGNVSFSSNNASVATVSNAGVVTPVAQGTAIITASWDGHPDGQIRTALCTVTVAANPADGYANGIEIKSNGQKTVTFYAGQSAPITIHKLKNGVVDDSLAGDITYEITGPSYVRWTKASSDGINYYDSVDSNGYKNGITAVTPGTVQVKVTLTTPAPDYHEYTDQITVTVQNQNSDGYGQEVLTVSGPTQMYVGDTAQFTITSKVSGTQNNGFEGAYNYAKDKYSTLEGESWFSEPYYTLEYTANNNGILSRSNNEDIASATQLVNFVKGTGQYGLSTIPTQMQTETLTATGLGTVTLTFKSHYGPGGDAGEDGASVTYQVQVVNRPNVPDHINISAVQDTDSDKHNLLYTDDNKLRLYEYGNSATFYDEVTLKADVIGTNGTSDGVTQNITWTSSDPNIAVPYNRDSHIATNDSIMKSAFDPANGEYRIVTLTATSAEDPNVSASIDVKVRWAGNNHGGVNRVTFTGEHYKVKAHNESGTTGEWYHVTDANNMNPDPDQQGQGVYYTPDWPTMSDGVNGVIYSMVNTGKDFDVEPDAGYRFAGYTCTFYDSYGNTNHMPTNVGFDSTKTVFGVYAIQDHPLAYGIIELIVVPEDQTPVEPTSITVSDITAEANVYEHVKVSVQPSNAEYTLSVTSNNSNIWGTDNIVSVGDDNVNTTNTQITSSNAYQGSGTITVTATGVGGTTVSDTATVTVLRDGESA